MSLTTSALQIGKSALIAYQQALQLTGNNIANAGSPNFSRLSARFDPRNPNNVSGLRIGAGVQISAIQRHVLDSLDARVRTATSDQQSSATRSDALSRIETIYDGLGDTNLGTAISNLFKSFRDLQNDPEDGATRTLLVNRAETLGLAFKRTRTDLLSLRDDLNANVVDQTRQADQIASQIADLNVQIAAADSGGPGQSAGLRDQRDALLADLSNLIQIQTREQPNGAVSVYVGNEPLVQFGTSRGLKTTLEPVGQGLSNAVVRFADTNGQAEILGGQIGGAISTRDNNVDRHLTQLNTLATAVIQEVNKRHASGQGLTGFSALTGTYAVADPTAALNSAAAGLALAPQSGSFFINVTDAGGTTKQYQINIDLDGLNGNDTTLNSLAAQINAQTGGAVTATVLPDGRLDFQAATGTTFTFGDDRSNVLAALGINTFFTGTGAGDISVNALISASPSFIAASSSGRSGDGANAGLLANLADLAVTSLGGAKIPDFYQSLVTQSAVDSNGAKNSLDASETIVGALHAQRESISGVNLDEETVKLITYQRSYQGAAQYISVINEMLQTLLSLVR